MSWKDRLPHILREEEEPRAEPKRDESYKMFLNTNAGDDLMLDRAKRALSETDEGRRRGLLEEVARMIIEKRHGRVADVNAG